MHCATAQTCASSLQAAAHLISCKLPVVLSHCSCVHHQLIIQLRKALDNASLVRCRRDVRGGKLCQAPACMPCNSVSLYVHCSPQCHGCSQAYHVVSILKKGFFKFQGPVFLHDTVQQGSFDSRIKWQLTSPEGKAQAECDLHTRTVHSCRMQLATATLKCGETPEVLENSGCLG